MVVPARDAVPHGTAHASHKGGLRAGVLVKVGRKGS